MVWCAVDGEILRLVRAGVRNFGSRPRVRVASSARGGSALSVRQRVTWPSRREVSAD